MKTDSSDYLGRSNEQWFGQYCFSESLCCRASLLTERMELKRAMLGSIQSMHLHLRHVRSLRLIKAAILKRSCDVAIIDIERCDVWPNVIFNEFDRIATDFPVIMLCSEKSKALDYIQRAENAVDIFSYDVVGDLRFGCVVHAAKLRAEARGLSELDRGFNWMSLSAA